MKGQHRLTRVQLVNWGTFHGAFDLAVPRSGLLLTGPSGSGKSSLLDALASVLVQPRWLSFNAAAQEGAGGDRTRSIVSYVRGAYKREADDAGEVTTAYLRPGATWSGIAVTFTDGAGQVTTLARLLHLPRGTNASDAVSTLFVAADEPVGLMALQRFAENGIATRQLKAAHPGWLATATYPSFAARLQKRLGLASDQAQRLLHKTQSAKNLTSLDSLLRDFMLDEPDTFDEVARAVDQFGELSAAHASVVDARRQVDALRPLRGIAAERAAHLARRDELAVQREHLETVQFDRNLAAADAALDGLERRLAALEPEITAADKVVDERQATRDAARLAVDRAGGQDVAALAESLVVAEERRTAVAAERARRVADADAAGLVLPGDESEFARFTAEAAARASGLTETDADREARFALASGHADAQREVTRLTGELRALAGRRSNIDERLLAVRDALVSAAGVEAARLPFAGEMLDVRSEESAWTGAIERVLRPFAQTLLVPGDLYPLVSEYIDAEHLGVRLVYERVPGAFGGEGRGKPEQRSLVRKLAVADGECAAWVRAELARRYDYVCVDSVAELRGVRRGVTRAGQVRHSDTRHEKDDRRRVDDRRGWLLGTSTEGKRQTLEADLVVARRRAETERVRRNDADAERGARLERARVLSELATLSWPQIDVVAARGRVDALRARHTALLGDPDLARARAAYDRAEGALAEATRQRQDLRDARTRAEASRDEWAHRRDRWASAQQGRPPVPEAVAAALGMRLDALGADNDVAAARLSRTLEDEASDMERRLDNAARRAERLMQSYKAEWPQQGADLAIHVDYLPDYQQVLDGLEGDRLPDFEDRFFGLLQSQARNNIGSLALRINHSRREIRGRIDPINDSLRRTEFAPGRYLHVRVTDRRLPEVTDFLRDLAEITSGSVEDALGSGLDTRERQQAEERFLRMQALLRRLASAEPVDVRWRTQCLDTRLHVQFVAEVRDADGRAVDFFTGAGGLSGGERQKLVIFCLAAALRYQLARDGADMPAYGLVVLDEAFDKTDPAFTRAGLEVFQQFGFQLLLATPLKMLQTLEDYVGGAAVVLNESGSGSRLEVMAFDREPAGAEAPAGTEGEFGQETLL